MILKIPLKLSQYVLNFRSHKPMPHTIQGKPCKTAGAYIFMVNNKTYTCVVDYDSKFLLVKQTDESSVHSVKKNR